MVVIVTVTALAVLVKGCRSFLLCAVICLAENKFYKSFEMFRLIFVYSVCFKIQVKFDGICRGQLGY